MVMQQLLDNWPLIVLAQALGVGVALSADCFSWQWRRDEKLVFALNRLALIGAIPLAALLTPLSRHQIWSESWFGASVKAVFPWLLVATWVQTRQLKTSLRAAFFGVLMQLECFVVALIFGSMALGVFWMIIRLWFVQVWLVSALATYFSLTLFRPTIHGTWQAWRRNSRKT